MKKQICRILSCLSFLTLPAFAGEGGSTWSVDWDGSSKAFIENKGQFYTQAPTGFSSQVLYAYDASSTRIFFTPAGVTFSFAQKTPKEVREHGQEKFSSEREFLEKEKEEHAALLKTDLVSYRWENASPNAQLIAENETPDYFNYSFNRNGKQVNETNIRGYQKLTYKDLYPGIDVVYTIHPQSGIKYAIVVHPGADLSAVKMQYSGPLNESPSGDMRIPTSFGDIIDHAPVSFYENDNSRSISTSFIKKGRTIMFQLDIHDPDRTVVIDPWTQTPSLPNSNKIWETETDKFGNVYIYGGDSFIKLLKYNSGGTLQWTYTSPWDSANYWIGGFVTDPNGNSYMTSGSNGEIRKITPAGAVSWSNNPNGLTSYEYWSLAFNCDQTKLYVGGTKLTFGFPVNIKGYIFEINLANGTQANSKLVGYGSSSSIPPTVQEVSSICTGPNNSLYYLTLDTCGSVNNSLTTVNFRKGTTYNFDYYIPGYGFGTKQPISAIRASATAFYTVNGTNIHKRDLSTGNVLATATIPGGASTGGFGGTKLPSNGGIDIDSCGNVYVGSTNGVYKYDANLNLITSVATTFAVYDVDVNSNGEVAACGWSGGVGKIQTFNMSACRQFPYVCVSSVLSATASNTNILCNGQCTGTATASATGGTSPYTYSWNTSPSQSTVTATGLCAGSYTCTVTDNVGATTTVSVTVTQPSAITSSVTPTNVSCNGGNNGQAAVTASGGTGGLNYNWSPSGGTNATATGLAAGNYTCTITDANGCTHQQTVTITQPSAITSSVTPTNVSCNGGNNGQAAVTASGGTGGLNYNWSPSGGTNATATGLAAGNYTCTITDANGCTHQQTVTITQPSAITASASATPTACSGNTGTATATASGGTGTFTYSWAPSGGTNANATGLTAGAYTVFVTDGNGCTQTATTTVNSSNGPTVTLQSQTNVSCNGGNNGAATMNATGGNAPYTYNWTPSGGTNANATGLSAGTYTCTVTDNNGCSQLQTVTITEPTAISGSTSTTGATCGNNNGSASVTASGGTGPYTYSWSNSQTGANATGLGAASYTVYITDANGCTQTATAVVSNTNGPAVSVQSQTNVSCNGGNNGDATVSASGGTSPYTYSWSTGGTNANETGLSAGTYTVTVTDAGGCSSVQTITITQPSAISASATSTPTGCNSSTGSATASASGGTGPYTYSWNNSQTGITATGLGVGTYTVTVTDANGCTQTANVSVIAGNAPTVAVAAQQNVTCNGNTNGSATVNVTGGTSPYTYSWAPSGGTSASANGLAAGTYTVFVTDANGCTSQVTVTITQPSALSLALTSIPACGTNNGTATANASGGTASYTYAWSPAGGTNASAGGLSAGTYTCTITDANGCTQTSTVNVVTNAFPTADAGSDVSITMGNSATLNASGGGTYSWSNGATTSTITVSPTTTTSYCVLVTSSAGCTDSACVTVNVNSDCGELFVPNAFSPNADGENDVLKVYGGCIKDLQFSIYDRWGEKVFETSDPNIGWDGKYRNEVMNTAVFVYRLEVTLLTGETISKKGNVSLIR